MRLGLQEPLSEATQTVALGTWAEDGCPSLAKPGGLGGRKLMSSANSLSPSSERSFTVALVWRQTREKRRTVSRACSECLSRSPKRVSRGQNFHRRPPHSCLGGDISHKSCVSWNDLLACKSSGSSTGQSWIPHERREVVLANADRL